MLLHFVVEGDHLKKPVTAISIPTKGKTPLLLVILLFVAVFFLGRLSAQVELIKKGSQTGGGVAVQTTTQGQTPIQGSANNPGSQQGAVVSVSVDDDPFMGEENAPVVMIEFSDFECPFCKRFWEQSLPQIKTNYIDTGKVRFVYRDLPLPIHDPLATLEALAANCARDQQGDQAYFRYHDEIFTRTTSGGTGIPKDGLYAIAAGLGLDAGRFRDCLDSEKFKGEVSKDIADAQKVGASGTPTLLIGKSSTDGKIQAERIIGAQPYVVFQQAFEKYLN